MPLDFALREVTNFMLPNYEEYTDEN